MKILNAAHEAERKAWIAIWQEWDGKEVYAHPDYVSLYLDEYSQACCAVSEDKESTVIYPFILRDVSAEPCYEASMGKIYDIITAYGYGGCYMWGAADRQTSVTRFYAEFQEWAQQNRIVSEFIRFSLDSVTREFYPGRVEPNNDNVVVDLTADKETMWHNFKHKVRKNVNRALNNQVKVECDLQGENLEAFLEIYYSTMERREADSGYYFPREYFETIGRNLKGQFAYFHALYEGKVISTELVLVSDYNIYSFLGGTKEEYFDLRPNDLLKYEIINWGRENGKKWFILGGGYTPHDGIFNYKLAFAPEGIRPFYVGKQIFDPQIYELLVKKKQALCEACCYEWSSKTLFFPLYRIKF